MTATPLPVPRGQPPAPAPLGQPPALAPSGQPPALAPSGQPPAAAPRKRPRTRALRGRDPLGLRRALADGLLPALVAAMTLLGGLALGAAQGAGRLADRWQAGAAVIAVELPEGTEAATAAGIAERLGALPAIAAVRRVGPAEQAALLRPWLGSVALPELAPRLELRPADPDADPATLTAAIAAVAPDARIEPQGLWVGRLRGLAQSVRALALAAVALVAGVAAAVIGLAVRSGITARREQIAILHHLGATDGDIANRFAARVGGLSIAGAAAGAALAIPPLAALGALGGALLGATDRATWDWAAVPFASLAALPVAVGAIGWIVAQTSVRAWLARLP